MMDGAGFPEQTLPLATTRLLRESRLELISVVACAGPQQR